MATRCKKGTRKCVDGRCYKKRNCLILAKKHSRNVKKEHEDVET